MKYTEEQYERGRRFRQMYYGGDQKDYDNWETLSEWRRDDWVEGYLTPLHQDFLQESGLKARTKTYEFFAAKEKKVTPSIYTFVSTDKGVDLLRIANEADEGTKFILIECKNRNTGLTGKVWLLVSHAALNNPVLQNGILYDQQITPSWGISFTEGWRVHFVAPESVQGVREQIELLIRSLNPKDTKTTVTVW